MTMTADTLAPVTQFLHCATPDAWIAKAKKREYLPLLLTDHMICELKAAQTAMHLLRKYAVDEESGGTLLQWLKPYEDFIYYQQGDLHSLTGKSRGLSRNIMARMGIPYGQSIIDKMVLLIKEELHHFYQVLEIMVARHIAYDKLSPGRYARGLMHYVRHHEPAALVDKLICGAYIEARSCERFARLAPWLDQELQRFYLSLLRSEARHYADYLQLAQEINGADISARVELFGQVEAELILSDDNDFKFHSGSPINQEMLIRDTNYRSPIRITVG